MQQKKHLQDLVHGYPYGIGENLLKAGACTIFKETILISGSLVGSGCVTASVLFSPA